jgi:hypothetical protein
MVRRDLTKRALRAVVLAGVFASAVRAASGAETPQETFAKSWAGTHVVVKQPLYTLVYNERGRLGNTYRSKRTGVTVTTPFHGSYFQFDGQNSEVDITDKDPQRLMSRITETYRRSLVLNEGTFQKIEPLLLVRYEPGVQLVVKTVRVEVDRIKVTFVKDAVTGDDAHEIATALSIKWPVPFSAALSEREQIDALIRQFVDVAETRH